MAYVKKTVVVDNHIRIEDQEETLCGKVSDVTDVIPDMIQSDYVLETEVGLCPRCLSEYKDDFIDGRFDKELGL